MSGEMRGRRWRKWPGAALGLALGFALTLGLALAGVAAAAGADGFAGDSDTPVLALAGTVRTPERPGASALEVFQAGGIDYLELNHVARLFHGTKYWRAELEKMVLKVNGHRVRLTVGSPFVFVDDAGTNLLAPVRWHDGRILVPVGLLTDVLDPLVPESVTWNPGLRRLRVDTGDPNIVGVGWDARSNGTVVTIRLTTALRGMLSYPRPDRIVLSVPDGVLSRSLEEGFPGRGLVDSLEAAQSPGVATLTFHLGPLGGAAELLVRSSPPRLVVVVSEGMPEDVPLPEFERAVPESARVRDLKTLVIDAGHGGSDAGVVVADGVPEKDVTLAIATALRDLLESSDGLEVRMTRTGDQFVAAADRAGLANGAANGAASRVGAVLMLSIHANGWFDSGPRGFSVGVLPEGSPPGEGGFAPWGSRPLAADRAARRFAEVLREELRLALPLPDAGMRTEAWAELLGTEVPAVHLECGFLTNPEDAALLTDPGFQEGVAGAIALAVAEYRRVLADEEGGNP